MTEQDSFDKTTLKKTEKKLPNESKLRRKIYECVQELLETVSEEDLVKTLPYLDYLSWDEVVEERFLGKICGLPICSNPVVHVSMHKYHIDRKSNKIYETCKERSKFCSEQCFNVSLSIRVQLDTQPLWITGESFKRMHKKYVIEKPKLLVEEINAKPLEETKAKRTTPYVHHVQVVEDSLIASMNDLKIAERDGSSTEEENDDIENLHVGVREDSGDELLKKDDLVFKESVSRFVSSRRSDASKSEDTSLPMSKPSSINVSPKLMLSPVEQEKLSRIRAKYSNKAQTRKPILIDAPRLSIKKVRETNKAEAVTTNNENGDDSEVGTSTMNQTDPIMVDPTIIVTPCSNQDIKYVVQLMREWWCEKSTSFLNSGGLRPSNDVDYIFRRFLAGDRGEDMELEDVHLPEVDIINIEKRRLQILLQSLKPTWLLMERRLDLRSSQLNSLSLLLSTFRLTADNIVGFERQQVRLLTAIIWRMVCRFNDELEETFFPSGFFSKEICEYLAFCGVEEPAFAMMCDDVLQLVQ